jgi:hypothetical protein
MQLCKIGFTAQLAEVFQAMKAYITIVERYQQGCMVEPDMCQLSDQRNLIQYHLLSLSSAREFGQNFSQNCPVYEICRLAGLIFSIGVIFPLPAQTAPFQTLVRLLQVELQRLNLESTWCTPDGRRVLIWALTLGSIAAAGFPEKTCFVAALGKLVVHYGLSRWRDLKQVLESILWLDTACDSAAQQLWDEIKSSVSSG